MEMHSLDTVDSIHRIMRKILPQMRLEQAKHAPT